MNLSGIGQVAVALALNQALNDMKVKGDAGFVPFFRSNSNTSDHCEVDMESDTTSLTGKCYSLAEQRTHCQCLVSSNKYENHEKK